MNDRDIVKICPWDFSKYWIGFITPSLRAPRKPGDPALFVTLEYRAGLPFQWEFARARKESGHARAPYKYAFVHI